MRKRRRPILLGLLVLVCGLAVLPTAVQAAGGGWLWPLRPRPEVVRGFEPPAGPYAPGHRGVDLAGAVGQPVFAVADGVVQFAGTVAGRGVVVVDHGAERSTYQPVRAMVRRGEQVSAGQPVGHLQLGGSHCWPLACLHLGRVAATTYLDPLALLGGGPVRLLPMDGPLPAPPAAFPPQPSRAPPPPITALRLGLRLGADYARG